MTFSSTINQIFKLTTIMTKLDNLYFKSMCIFNYEHNNNILTTIVYFKNSDYNIIEFHNSCVLVAKINNCLNLNIISGSEVTVVELNNIIATIEVSIGLVQQLQHAIDKQLTSITI